MKLDSKLKQLLADYSYEIISKNNLSPHPYYGNIKYSYISNDIIEFKLTNNTFSHNIIRYNFSSQEFSITQKVDINHPVCGSFTVDDDSEEIWGIFSVLQTLNRKNTDSYINEDCACIVFYPNGDWEGIFDIEVYDRVAYIAGVYKYQNLPADSLGRVSSTAEIETTNFITYDDLEAFMFQKESTERFSASVGGVMNLLRDYHK